MTLSHGKRSHGPDLIGDFRAEVGVAAQRRRRVHGSDGASALLCQQSRSACIESCQGATKRRCPLQRPEPVYVPDGKLLGGNLGLSVTIPAAYVNYEAQIGVGSLASREVNGWGFGDVIPKFENRTHGDSTLASPTVRFLTPTAASAADVHRHCATPSRLGLPPSNVKLAAGTEGDASREKIMASAVDPLPGGKLRARQGSSSARRTGR